MITAKYESDSNLGTELSVTQFDTDDTVLQISGGGEFRISASGGKLTGIRLSNIKSLFSEIINELNKGVLLLDKEQFAEMLNGRMRGNEITVEEQEIAKENGLVVVFGYSDDGMIFNGAIRGQVDCWRGGIACLNQSGLAEVSPEDSHCKSIRAVCASAEERLFNGKPYWSYETDIPHVKFLIYEHEVDDDNAHDIDDDVWCEGIIFDMATLL